MLAGERRLHVAFPSFWQLQHWLPCQPPAEVVWSQLTTSPLPDNTIHAHDLASGACTDQYLHVQERGSCTLHSLSC